MRRDEGYLLLSVMASDEIIASHVSQKLFSIRDSMVCERGEQDARYNTFAYLTSVAENEIISRRFHEGLINLANEIYSDLLENCENAYGDYCKKCKFYKGGR